MVGVGKLKGEEMGAVVMHGGMNFRGAQIGGAFRCQKLVVYGRSGDAFRLNNAKSAGSVVFEEGFRCLGVVSITGMGIGGDLVLSGIRLRKFRGRVYDVKAEGKDDGPILDGRNMK